MAKKSVKGYASRMKSLTTSDLYDMDKKELERFLAYESKLITKRLEKLIDSGLGDYSPLLIRRMENKRPLPRTIGLKEAKRMTIKELREEIVELSYIAKSKTSSIQGTKKYLKSFKETTGMEATSLSSADWSEIRKKLEESPEYDSNDVISSYQVQSGESDEEYQTGWDERIKATEYARYEREQSSGFTTRM